MPYEEGKTTSNAKRKRRTTVRLSLSKKQYSIFMLRAAARIQSNLLCKFINSGSMAQATLSCRYAAIHLVYLGIYTREEKMCPQDAFFLRDSLESVVSSERLFGKRSFSTVSKGRTKRFVLCFYSSSEIALRIAASCCSTASSRLLSSSGFSPLMASVSTALT